MHFHTNHMWCSRSCWTGGIYDCKFLVSIDRIGRGKKYHDTPEEDWMNLTEEFSFFSKEDYNRSIKFYKEKGYETDKKFQVGLATKTAFKLKPEIIAWLNKNVKDRQDKEQPQGWCYGNADYLSTNPLSVSLFFHRRSDAMAFIKKWSTHQKPTSYCDYFKNIRKELDFKTNKLIKIDSF